MKYKLLCFFLLYSVLTVAQRQKIELDGDWNFRIDRDSIGWKSWMQQIPEGRMVKVPHTWNVEDGTERYWGQGWYQREFNVPADWKGQQIRLHFDAVYRDAVIFLNGKEIGKHTGTGYTPFSFDITKSVIYGNKNRITVSVSNKFSKQALPFGASFDWSNDGGIIRPVYLTVTGKPSIRYAHVNPEVGPDKNLAKTHINIKMWEQGIKKALFTFTFTEWKTGQIVKTEKMELESKNDIFSTQIDFDQIKQWHFDDPNLYVMQVDVSSKGEATDSYKTRFGFRKLEIKGHQLFFNGEPVRLPGIEYMPGSHPRYGMAEPVEVLSQAVDMMKNLNCVITRFHWQQDVRILDLMDEKGILVQQEIPWWQSPGDLTPELETLAKKQIDDMIERDYNRPCMFSWGMSNEVFHNTDKNIYRRLIDHAKSWKTPCFITVVSNLIFERLEDDESLLADIPTWNDYVGTWHGKVREETPDKLKLINERALRGRPLLITEHGLCEPRFVGADPRRITEMTYHYDQWAKNDYILGCIYFSLNDYRTHVGESGKGRYQTRVHGLTDLWFNKKPSFAVYAGLASPVYFEYVQQTAKGTEANVSIHVKSSLPSYTLKGYKIVWKAAGGKLKETHLPDLKPGDKYQTVINDLDPWSKSEISVIRPTGYIAAKND